MKVLPRTFPSPAANLAADEALLDAAENGAGGEVLRFWESPSPFVVVGYANKIATEANVSACAARGVPILRRCSGGGTVVQGPGCLNFALVLRIVEGGPTATISQANTFIMERNRAALATVLAGRRAPVRIEGYTDLALGDLKFSGNAQRRRKHFLLFHGTFLLNFDLPLIAELLAMPTFQPDYRASRPHERFITNLEVPTTAVTAALQQVWNAHTPLTTFPEAETAHLTTTRYSTPEWNEKF